ncbi:MAG: VOC family protein [Dehalococcoidia bacterium]
MAGVSLFRVIVPVADIEAGAVFYARLLDHPGERVSALRHYFDCDGVILACVQPYDEVRARPARPEDFRPNPDRIYLATEDLEAAYARAADAGCDWLEEAIATRDWGERSFYLRDPFGNPLCFVDAGTEFRGGRFVR